MDIIDVIRDDHTEIQSLMEKIETTVEQTVERQVQFSELRKLLEAHINAERRILYQRLEGTDELADQMLDSYEEHDLLSGLLQSLSEMEMNSADWITKFKILKDSFENHLEEEESLVLATAQDIISDEEREDMGDDMRSLEEEIISSGPVLVTQTAQAVLDTPV